VSHWFCLLVSLCLAAFAVVNVEAQGEICTVCQDLSIVVEFFIKYEGWNSTQVYDQMKYLCSLLGSYETECDAMIYLYGYELAVCWTAQVANNTQCCHDVGACIAQPKIARNPTAKVQHIIDSVTKDKSRFIKA